MNFVLRNFVNKSARGSWEVKKVSNVGTFLSKLDKYSHFEQYFAAGIYDIDSNLNMKLSDISKNLVKLCKTYGIKLDRGIYSTYITHSVIFQKVFETECASITVEEKRNLFGSGYVYYNHRFFELINTHNYNVVSLIKYIDNLITYEALTISNVINELYDYCRMMSEISPKFEKYPKNFLTTHAIANRNYRRLKEYFDELAFEKTIDKTLEWSVDEYKIICPKCTQDMKDEAVNQNNCLASYIRYVIDGTCKIVFLRLKDSPESSLVTMEIRDNKVVQAKGSCNRDLTIKEQTIVDKYNKYLERRLKQSTLTEIVYENMEAMIAC